MHLSNLFIDNKFHGHLIHSHIKRLVAEWWERWTCNLEAVRCHWFESYRGQDFFCNVHLFRLPRSVQMKSSMTFIRGNRCIEREKDNFKSREVKRLKECALALTRYTCTFLCPRNGNWGILFFLLSVCDYYCLWLYDSELQTNFNLEFFFEL